MSESDTEYPRDSVVGTCGGLEFNFDVGQNQETSVEVDHSPEGIGLHLSNEIGVMRVLLLPEDIKPLCRALLDAKEKTQPDDVEETREWIARYRNGDGDD